jgi:hypothetical protein
MAPATFDSMIPHQSEGSKPISIGQAAQKMNGDRPTINALQKAGRAAENRKAFVTPQDDEDHEALAAQWEAEVAAGTARERRGSSSDGSDNELFISVETPSLPRHKPLKGKGKGKEKEKELAKNSRKRKVRFEDEEEEERNGPVLRSGRLSTKTKKARGAKSIL